MKHLALYLMLLAAIPATAQHGVFGSHSHHHSHPSAEHHSHGPLIHHPDTYSASVPCMSSEDFEFVVDYLSKKTFDSDRLEAAKHIVRENWVSARQIATICKLFTFDSNMLEFAKYAYASCSDKGMYFLVGEALKFSSSRDELYEYIEHW